MVAEVVELRAAGDAPALMCRGDTGAQEPRRVQKLICAVWETRRGFPRSRRSAPCVSSFPLSGVETATWLPLQVCS